MIPRLFRHLKQVGESIVGDAGSWFIHAGSAYRQMVSNIKPSRITAIKRSELTEEKKVAVQAIAETSSVVPENEGPVARAKRLRAEDEANKKREQEEIDRAIAASKNRADKNPFSN